VRLRRFSLPDQALGQRLQKALRILPLGVPLAAGMLCAGVIDAVIPEPAHARVDRDGVATAETAPVGDPPPEPGVPHFGAAGVAADGVQEDELVATDAPLPAAARRSTRTATVKSTRDDALEARIDKLLVDGRTPYGAVVVMDAHTGRVLALAEHSTRGAADGLALRPIAPAASVFKVVTASALLSAGVDANDEACFHGGRTRMTARLLQDDPRRDRCMPFADVLPKSANVAIAKLASRKLTPTVLRAEAARWGFGVRFADVDGLLPSSAVIPEASFPFAEAAAGFGDVKISALHGAVIASIVANDGVLVRPVLDADQEPEAPLRVIPTRHARALKKMLADTVTDGTARRAFRQGPRLATTAAGKTGSLTDYGTGLDTSWFVGFAPVEAPQFIVSALVVNTARWHIKAPWLAKEALRLAVEQRGAARASSRVAAR
jgi:cell division protein FtsI/penicillin-binding protein 2